MLYILLLIGAAWIGGVLVLALALCQAAKRGDAWLEEQDALHVQPLTGAPRATPAQDATPPAKAAMYPLLHPYHYHARTARVVDMLEHV